MAKKNKTNETEAEEQVVETVVVNGEEYMASTVEAHGKKLDKYRLEARCEEFRNLRAEAAIERKLLSYQVNNDPRVVEASRTAAIARKLESLSVASDARVINAGITRRLAERRTLADRLNGMSQDELTQQVAAERTIAEFGALAKPPKDEPKPKALPAETAQA